MTAHASYENVLLAGVLGAIIAGVVAHITGVLMTAAGEALGALGDIAASGARERGA